MSTVYAVVHSEIGKRAALKVVHGHVLSSSFPPARVLLEAQVVNRIAHSNIVDIFENGSLPDGRPFLVMERLEGCSLEQLLVSARIPAEDVIEILLQICAALTAAHAAGIVHCDLKPENVFLVGEGVELRRVKVLDWGISRIFTPRARPGRTEMALGTPRYISPEQVQGLEPSPSSDIYSLGVMAYELFLEEQLFVADSTLETLKMHLHATPPPPDELWPNIPPALTHLLLTMLAKKPATRPTATEVASELTSIREELRQRNAVTLPAPAQPLAEPPVQRAVSAVEHLAPAAPAHSIERTERRRHLARKGRRRVGGAELMAVAVAILLIASTSALLGYRTARGNAEASTAADALAGSGATPGQLSPLPALEGSMAASMAASIAGSMTASVTGPMTASLATAVAEASPPSERRADLLPLASAADAPASDAGARRCPPLTARGGAAANGGCVNAARKLRPTARRAPARTIDPNGTIEPY